ncbi:MAG: DNA internalization-related competence protein ComEC/Rec2 [Desulfuromusa sp.]|jgi:competence protein ComEC|nr:DNA internalization-related competence protein ComEC/Rec2 [Desulfuromusa sp.]
MQPVLIVLSATVAGLSLAPIFALPHFSGWLFVAFTALMFFLLRKYSRVTLVLLFLSVFVFSNLRYPLQFPSRQDIIYIDKLAQKMTLTGRLTDIRQLTEGRSWLELLVDSVAQKDQQIVLESPLRVRLYMEEGTTQLFPGDIVRCKSRMRQPRLFGTPGEFNWPRYLASQHIDMTAWVKTFAEITVLDRQPDIPDRAMVQWRGKVATHIMGLMPEDRASLVRALVLGEGRIIPDRIRRVLAKSGISHLFAISGLHLGMIALLGYRLLLSIYRRFPFLLNWQPPQRALPLILLPLLLCYLLLTGDAVSTRRAFALATVGAVFLCWRYYVNPLLLLASLALLSLLANPLLFWQAGWQLSFAGAAGILLWRPLWQKQGGNLPLYLRYPLQLFLVTFAAMLATLPLVLINFHLFAPAGVFANLICVPIVTLLALPIGFSGLLFEPFFPQLAGLLFQLCGLLLESLLSLARWITALPGLGGTYLFLSLRQYLAVGLLVLPLLLSAQLAKQIMLRAVTVCFLSALILWQFPLFPSFPVLLTMFSVGQGESMLLQNNDSQTILIDGGGFYSDRFDVGERLLAPALGQLGVTKLTAVVLTHDDLDHRKGLVFVLDNFPVQEFWTGNSFSELHFSLQDVLLKHAIPVKIMPSGWSEISFWTNGDLNIFNGTTPGSNRNDSSLVMHLSHASSESLLLTGDLEEKGVLNLLNAGLPGPVSLLKLPHHGSRFSATDSLIDQLVPKSCLVSVGYQNRHHLPARQVVDYLQQQNIPLYRTDLTGTLQAQLSKNGWQVRHWQRGFFVDITP